MRPSNLNEAPEQLIELSIAIQQIAAPTGDEAQRAAWVADALRRFGYTVESDALHNVYACAQGATRAPALVVSAHTDTVFPAGTDLAIRRDARHRRIFGPGLGDNSLGVASLLWLAETIQAAPPLPADIWFVANVGEEGNGDLRGMRAAIDRLTAGGVTSGAPEAGNAAVGAAIVIEGMGLSRVVHQALASRRYRIHVTAPGGHSWSDFGAASAVHMLAQLAADLTYLRPPKDPRTTFNIGVIEGGTSVNTIAQSATLELDLRSEQPATLDAIVQEVMEIIARYQSTRWQQAGVSVTSTVIGDRPGGAIADDHPLVQAAIRSLQAVRVKPQLSMRISSTDANIPLSRGIPAVCIGVTEGGNAHRTDEWIATPPIAEGQRHLLALTTWAAEWLGEAHLSTS
ncbi:M20/M25/M40 family metallo-hydrolase [Caldilinea sp.]|uniref:M20/M25/M40 family metallo-hydrolase n=1 Tax=Caldilinea sp. TaxID=2293560 RepID=UPI002B6FB2AC|nr:M20/M25/M40 family metallo-hydrolase [Caldilinea sp.]